MTTISLKVPDELLARMDAVASKTPLSLFDRSTDLCGKESSELGDLASNPKHLEGFGS